jgi:hypothetical protein
MRTYVSVVLILYEKPRREVIPDLNFSLCLTNKVLHHKGVWRNGYIDSGILDLDLNWRRLLGFIRQAHYPRYQLVQRLSVPQKQYGQHGVENCLVRIGLAIP